VIKLCVSVILNQYYDNLVIDIYTNQSELILNKLELVLSQHQVSYKLQ